MAVGSFLVVTGGAGGSNVAPSVVVHSPSVMGGGPLVNSLVKVCVIPMTSFSHCFLLSCVRDSCNSSTTV